MLTRKRNREKWRIITKRQNKRYIWLKKTYRLWKRHRASWKGHRASLEKGQAVRPVKRTSMEHCPVQGCSRWISHKNEHTTDQNVLPYQGLQVFARFQLFNNVKITEQIVCSPKTRLVILFKIHVRVFFVFNATFNNISVICFIGGGTRVS